MKPFTQSVLGAVLLFANVSLIHGAPAKPVASAPERDSKKEARLGWWREAKFGMFIHWGLWKRMSVSGEDFSLAWN